MRMSFNMNKTKFSLFRERFLEACKVRDTTPDKVARSIGLGSRSSIDFEFVGWRSMDIYRLGQLADRLHVSIDWLLGRTSIMELPAEARPKRASLASAFRRG